MKCIECDKVAIKPYPAHAAIGLGRCTKERYAVFQSLIKDRACVMFVEAKKEVIEKRIIWHESRKSRR